MITKQELQQAISECQGQRNPTAQTCIKLAAYYTILEHTQDDEPHETYSFASAPVDVPAGNISYNGDSDFSKAVQGKPIDEVIELIEELVLTLQIANPKLYDAFMRKLG